MYNAMEDKSEQGKSCHEGLILNRSCFYSFIGHYFWFERTKKNFKFVTYMPV